VNLLQKIISSIKTDRQDCGIIHKIHGHFYYAKSLEWQQEITLTLPSRLSKEGWKVYVGDVIRFCPQQKTISEIFPRLSFSQKPLLANIDQAIIIVTMSHPQLNLEHLDLLLFQSGHSLPQKPLICFNKIDLEEPSPEILSLYSQELGYTVLAISTEKYIEEDWVQFKTHLKGKSSVVAGLSGVGKSSILNCLCPELKLKTGKLSTKATAGTHTTRHLQIHKIPLEENYFMLCDTPGFSRQVTELPLSSIINSQVFPEIALAKDSCDFPDCTHTIESGCQVRFRASRAHSYQKIIQQAREYEASLHNNHDNAKATHKKLTQTNIPILSRKQRAPSRKTDKQNFGDEELLDEMNININDWE